MYALAVFAPPSLERKLEASSARVAVVGLGHVGLPLAHAFWRAGLQTIGFDSDPEKIAQLACSESYIAGFASTDIEEMHKSGRFCATGNFTRLGDADAILVCVPTPVTAPGERDLRHVIAAAGTIATHLKPQMLVVLQSTADPRTVADIVLPILENRGLKAGRDFTLAFAQQNPASGMDGSIPGIVGIDKHSGAIAETLYARAFDTADHGTGRKEPVMA
jgi:UDP-N-acetyl-D-glucosamine dehydrogenase